MKLAYLVNQYPKVSHTFIRREIVALEAQGAEVVRVSVRSSPDDLVDADDQAEVAATRVILSVGIVGLLSALLREGVRSPVRFLAAFLLTLRMGWQSERGLLRHFAYLAEACVLRRWLAAAGCAHVHAHFGTNSTAVAMLCHVLGGPPYSFTAHGPEEFDKPLLIGLREKIERALFVVAISSFGRSQIFRYCGHTYWPKVHVVHCGLDASFLDNPATPIPSNRRMVSVGRLNEQKGQLLLVEAVAQLAQQGVDFELVLVGDGEMRGEIETLIARNGLVSRVKITGWASNDVVREHLCAARFMVLPSFAEGLPVVIMEALALGRPVVTTYVAGIPELVSAQCGWLVPAGSVDGLVDAMHRALSTSDEEMARLGLEGQRRAREFHDARKEAATLMGLFERYVGAVKD